MKRQWISGFYGEGNSDKYFFPTLCLRVLANMGPNEAFLPVEPLEKPSIPEPTHKNFLLAIAKEYVNFDLLFIHVDADAPDIELAYQNKILPVLQSAQASPKIYNTNWVAIIPVRNLEAWILADFEAFKASTGTKLPATELGFPPRPIDAEKLADPKATLNQALKLAYKKRTSNYEDELGSIAKRINLNMLRKLPAYQGFEQQLHTVLERVGIRDG
jgi:hypothetical protein